MKIGDKVIINGDDQIYIYFGQESSITVPHDLALLSTSRAYDCEDWDIVVPEKLVRLATEVELILYEQL